MIKEARFYSVENGRVKCFLCPHHCSIPPGQAGVCSVRECRLDNDELKLFTINYGEVTSMAIDPIEKKPLYHFQPGSKILSVGSFGCNFKCTFCQNYSISQYKATSKYISVDEMVNTILSIKDNIGVAFTYNEPSIWYEYAYDVAKELKKRSEEAKVVLVTNGYINEEPLKEILPYVDALNIDLKGDNKFYKAICNGSIKPVENAIEISNDFGKHIEITTLLIPNENTEENILVQLGDFISSINKDIVLHISRYFPRYKMDTNMTDFQDLKRAYKLLKERLSYVYVGNISEVEEMLIKKLDIE